MKVVLGAMILAGAAAGARRWTAGTLDDRIAEWLAGATVFFAIFLGAFLVQGYGELIVGRPIIALPYAAIFVAAAFAAAFVARKAGVPRVRSLEAAAPTVPDRWRKLPLAVVAAVLVVFVAACLLLLGGYPRGFEVRAYHLPLAVRILRDGTLGIWDASFMHAYPVNMSVWSGFFLDLVPERVVSIVNLPFLALLCTAVYALARAVGADRSAALLVCAGVATVPMIGASSLEVGADVAGVGFIAVATYLLVARPGPRVACASYAGLAAGIAYGFKSLHLIPGAMLGLLLLIECARDRAMARRAGVDRGASDLAPVAAFTLAATTMMSFWLVRNLVQAGNPLYPVHLGRIFDLFGWRAAPDFDLGSRGANELEWVGASWQWLVYPWVEGHYIDQNFKHSSGLGAFFAAVAPAVLLLWPLHAAVRGQSAHEAAHDAAHDAAPEAVLRRQSVVYLMAIVVVVAWWILGDRQPRYVITSVVFTFPLAAWLLSQAHGRVRSGYDVLLAICTLAMAFVLLVRVVATNGVALAQSVHATRDQLMEYPAAIDHLPPGSVIADSEDREHNYLLLGAGLGNHVVDMQEVDRRFPSEGGVLRLTALGIRQTGITHLYTRADRRLATDDCVRLHEVDRLERNPLNGRPYPEARVLYAVERTCEGAP